MNKEQFRKVQMYLLEELAYIDSICQKNGLKYYVHNGTLIGAARERGFIPWDLDIDIIMPKEDCIRLKEFVKQSGMTQYYIVDCKDSLAMSDRVVNRAGKFKVEGVGYLDLCIDIYSYANAKKYSKFAGYILDKLVTTLKYVKTYRKTCNVSCNKFHKIIVIIFSKLMFLMKTEDIIALIERLAISNKKTGFITVYNSYYGFPKETYPSYYFEKEQVLDFENGRVPVLAHYQDILTHLYGDWRKVPSGEMEYKEKDAWNFEEKSIQARGL